MKWFRLRALIDEFYHAHAINLLAIEEVRRHMGVDAAHAYGGALAVVSEWCEVSKIPYQSFPVGTIKKHATGKGNAKKDAMMEAARKKWMIDLVDDNHADALWIGDLASSEHSKGKK